MTTRRNPAGTTVVLLALAAGAALFLTKKKSKSTGTPTDLGSGWEVNDLCTNVDLLDADRAIAVGEAWSASQALPPPVSNDQRAKLLAKFFADTFPQCDPSAMPQILAGNVVMTLAEWAEMIGTGVDMQADPDRRDLMRVGRAILGTRTARVGVGPTGRILT